MHSSFSNINYHNNNNNYNNITTTTTIRIVAITATTLIGLLLLLLPSQTISFTTAVPSHHHHHHTTTTIAATNTETNNNYINDDTVCLSSDSMSTTTTTTPTTTATTSDQDTTMKVPSTMTFRTVQKVLERLSSSHWVGDGFHVLPVFGSKAFTNDISPLLMFDYALPKQFPPKPHSTKLAGVGQHPHRGFETVTIAFQGEVEHHDNAGNTGIIYPGDVQWMTAGRGIIHEEYHSKHFTKRGGTFEMCQLWVNLPKQYKMTKPTYQSITNEQIPVVNLPLDATTTDSEVLGTARIIAGEMGNTKGAAKTFSPVQVWDITVPKKDSTIDLPIPSSHQGMIFVRRGSVEVITDDTTTSGKKKFHQVLQPQEVGILRSDGSTTIRFRSLENNSSILVLGGEPLNEPIAAQGPFVMNTQEEIYQAMSDYRSGKFTAQ